MSQHSSIEALLQELELEQLEILMQNPTPEIIQQLIRLKQGANLPENSKEILSQVIEDVVYVDKLFKDYEVLVRSYLECKYTGNDAWGKRLNKWRIEPSDEKLALSMWNDLVEIVKFCGALEEPETCRSYIGIYRSEAEIYWGDKPKIKRWRGEVAARAETPTRNEKLGLKQCRNVLVEEFR
jgi:hypothetical protein